LYVDFDELTNIKGLFAAVDCEFFQHGGNRLGANSLVSAIYGGTVAGPNAVDDISNIDRGYTDMDESIFEKRKGEEQERVGKF
ncbi:hypothetical protein FE68_15505, partial [Staphylococcus aureus]